MNYLVIFNKFRQNLSVTISVKRHVCGERLGLQEKKCYLWFGLVIQMTLFPARTGIYYIMYLYTKLDSQLLFRIWPLYPGERSWHYAVCPRRGDNRWKRDHAVQSRHGNRGLSAALCDSLREWFQHPALHSRHGGLYAVHSRYPHHHRRASAIFVCVGVPRADRPLYCGQRNQQRDYPLPTSHSYEQQLCCTTPLLSYFRQLSHVIEVN